MIKSILTVCIGNICRSPMAEGLLKNGFAAVDINSAGIGALIGNPADPISVELMRRMGIDISSHRAQQINKLLCQQADLILVMDTEQRRYIEGRYPFARGKVFRLAESLKLDIPDPYKMDNSVFEHALSLIEHGSKDWVERTKKINEQERQLT